MHPEIVQRWSGVLSDSAGWRSSPRPLRRRRTQIPSWLTCRGGCGSPAALTVPLLALAMSDMLPGQMGSGVRRAGEDVDRGGARGARLRVGRVAVLRQSGAVDLESQPQHVHPHRTWRERRVRLQHRRDDRAGALSFLLPRRIGWHRCLLRGRRGHRHPDSVRPGARAAGTKSDGRSHPEAARYGRDLGAPGDRRRHRGGRADGIRAEERPVARAARREDSGRRRRARGIEQRRRVDGQRRADSRPQGGRRQRDRRDDQRHRHTRHPCGQGWRRDAAGSHRRDGRRRAAQPRADPEARRRRVRVLRSDRHSGRDRDVRGLGPRRARPTPGARPDQRCGGAHHRVSLRAWTRDADVDHGGNRQRRHCRRAVQKCRGD